MGMLALAGGNEFRANCEPMDRFLLEHLGVPRPRVVILPTAARERPDLAAANGVYYFGRLGTLAAAVMVVDRGSADDPKQAQALASAKLVYLAGGDPSYLLTTLRGSVVEKALREVDARGGMVAGSSAGAMVLAEWQRDFRQSGWIPALGLVKGVAVWPHFHWTEEINLVELRGGLPPDVTILGIAEATACLTGDGMSWEVAGVGDVTVIESVGAVRYTSGESFSLARSRS